MADGVVFTLATLAQNQLGTGASVATTLTESSSEADIAKWASETVDSVGIKDAVKSNLEMLVDHNGVLNDTVSILDGDKTTVIDEFTGENAADVAAQTVTRNGVTATTESNTKDILTIKNKLNTALYNGDSTVTAARKSDGTLDNSTVDNALNNVLAHGVVPTVAKNAYDISETNKYTKDLATYMVGGTLSNGDEISEADSIYGSLDAHDIAIEANKTAIESKANQSDVTALTTQVEANKTAIADKLDKADFTDTKNNAAAALSATQTNASNIAANTKAIAQTNQRIDDLRADTEHGLAQQAALTGLFQPYKVGKANFTAAVGGYKSSAAVAIGTGYRFDENFAAKAGVSFGGSGVSYNVGMNYEW